MVDLRKPYLTQPTLQGQVGEIRSYLFGLVEQLNYYLNNNQGGGTVVIDSSDEVKNAKALYAALKGLIEDDFTDDQTFNDYVIKTNESLDALNTFKDSTADRVIELKAVKVGDIDYRIRRWESGYTELEGLKPSSQLTADMTISLPKGLSSISTFHVEAESLSGNVLVAYKSVDTNSIGIALKDWSMVETGLPGDLGEAALRISATGFWKEEK